MRRLKERHLICPRCNSNETRRTRNFGQPVGDEQWCMVCYHRWEPGESMYGIVRDLPDVLKSALKSVGYNKKDIAIKAAEKVSIQDFGETGCRSFVVLVDLSSSEFTINYGSWGGPNPFVKDNSVDLDSRYHQLPENGAVITGSEGGGRPVSSSITLHPNNLVKFLPVKQELTGKEKAILYAYRSLKSGSYRQEELQRLQVTECELDLLVSKGLLKRDKRGIQITTDGKNTSLK